MALLITDILAVLAVLFAVVGIAGIVFLSRSYDGVMSGTDKGIAALGAVLTALFGYAVLAPSLF